MQTTKHSCKPRLSSRYCTVKYRGRDSRVSHVRQATRAYVRGHTRQQLLAFVANNRQPKSTMASVMTRSDMQDYGDERWLMR